MTLPEIVVEARGTAPVGDQVPAVTTITPEEIDATGAESTPDLSASAPAFVVHEAGDRKSNFLGIRGLSNAAGFGESSVGLYVDGLPYADPRGSFLELYDVDAVEVLRGPQTTTFGRNAESGAVNIRTPAPGNELRARGAVRLGTHAEQIYTASAAGPLVRDHAALGIAVVQNSRNGYIRNTFLDADLDDRDVFAGRGRLVLRPIPQLTAELIGEGQRADDGSKAWILLDQPDPFRVAYDTPGSSRLDETVAALRVRYEPRPWLSLTSLTGRRAFDSHDDTFDLDFSPAPIAVLADDYRFTDWTQEVRLTAAPAAAWWRGHIGGFFEDKTTEPQFTVRQLTPSRMNDRQAARFEARTWAWFGEVAVTPRRGLDVIAGLRVESFRDRMQRTHQIVVSGQRPTSVVPEIQEEEDSVAWLPNARLVWAPMPRTELYASAARGYRPGGLSFLTDDLSATRFRPQFGWTYEVGGRTTWLDGRVAASLALYWIRVSDYQNPERVGLVGFSVANARRVTSRGLEAEVTASPLTGLEVVLAGGVIHARYDDFCGPAGGRCFDGNQVMLAPDYTLTAGVRYRHPSGLVAETGCQGVGGYPFVENNIRGQGPYQLVSARLGWEWWRFGVYVYARNLADQTYFPFAIPPSGPVGYITTPGDPRTVGVMLTARL